ncbi:hypothetical protein HMPREF9134_01312 [Porphyromonas catoniae F0037]|uniref:Uncharacterized protein n=1 Tax=Porphyromonas catoniae F0037 TaxID=1127696 RepID=L1NBS3_9PORP|nr:hypothetical protein HMPREF9134_01312 [Porphyromonas catoniae F0037]
MLEVQREPPQRYPRNLSAGTEDTSSGVTGIPILSFAHSPSAPLSGIPLTPLQPLALIYDK